MDRAARRARDARAAMGQELREARFGAGLTQAAVGRAAGVSHCTVSRVEAGTDTSLTIDRAARLFATVGLDLSVRAFPAGTPIRDAAHIALITRARAHSAATSTGAPKRRSACRGT